MVEVEPERFEAMVREALDGLVRETHAGSSYLSSEDPRANFGLGGATRLRELVVRRPDGTTTRLQDVAADRLVTVR